MAPTNQYEGPERRMTARRALSSENDILVAVLEERLHNIKEENRRDHEMIMNKLDETAKVQIQIIDIQVQIAKIITSNNWRDWAVRLLYTGGIIALLFDLIKTKLKG